MNIVPETAPFTREQRAWLNGFLAGVFHDRLGAGATAGAAAPVAATPARPLLVGYGSQSGSAAGLAKRFGKLAESRGFRVTLRELNAVSLTDLAAAGLFVVITSTWGDGEPPDNATTFWASLASDTAPSLAGLSYAVLGLGDRNYADFCGAARGMDERLAALGGRRLTARAECDVDYEASATAWIEALWPVLDEGPVVAVKPAAEVVRPVEAEVVRSVEAEEVGWTRKNPYLARMRVARPLNGPGSAKDTRHVEILLGDSGISYAAGDALGVMPQNCPALVEELLATLGLTGDERVDGLGGVGLHEALMKHWVVTQPTAGFMKLAAAKTPGSLLAGMLEPARKPELDAWLPGRDLIDVLRAAPGARWTVAELAEHLRPLQPRLYSISSSPKAHPGEVHLTVGAVRYELHGRVRKGVASCWLADRVVPGETPVPVFVHVSRNFRPPTDPTLPMIMVGPGTGIAPFRAFLEERRATGATGRNWLFFGDQRRSTDFLYAEELEPMHRDGFLTRMDLAFSRDQSEKIYVQDRMRESGAELWRWLEAGGHFYVCGDAKRMAKDVEAALLEIVQTHGDRNGDQAAEYLEALRAVGRYQRDVY
jgi:sulfite reductase (NADPH) flavoprotein alpha-component